MLTSAFNFDLPEDLIAQNPVEPRDCARLMVIDRRRGSWEHCTFTQLPELLSPKDILARNNTRVLPARLLGRRAATGGKWEGLFLRELPDCSWEILATTRGRPALGEHVIVGQGLDLVLEARGEGGSWITRPQRTGKSDVPTIDLLDQHGQTPLPPYIRRGRATTTDRWPIKPSTLSALDLRLHQPRGFTLLTTLLLVSLNEVSRGSTSHYTLASEHSDPSRQSKLKTM